MKETFRSLAALLLAFVTVAGASARAQSPPQSAIPTAAGNGISPTAPAPALPPGIGIDSTSPLGQVVKLLQSGAAENAILADINQSSQPFHLNAVDIAYLYDLGVPADIETAMIQRDKALGATDDVTLTPAQAQLQQTAMAPPAPDQAQDQDVTEDYFYGALAPYGKWIDLPGYGICWQPCAAIYDPNWSPYCTQGQWVYTDSGWYWLSGYSWGWCAFHYGRWFHDASRGWCWWPATIWAPSWVFWRYGGNYCGWAPLPPHCYYSQENETGLVYNGAAVPDGYDFGMGANLFNFVPLANLCDANTERFRLPAVQAAQAFARSRVILNISSNDRTIANDGIPVSRIYAVTGKEVRSFKIQPVKSVALPGTRGEQILADGETLAIARPYFKTGVPSSLRQGIWPVPVQVQPELHQPPSIIVNENPISYAAQDNQGQDNSVIYMDSAAQNAPPVPTVTTAGPQDNAGPAPSAGGAPGQSYWSVSAEAPAPIDTDASSMSPRRRSREHMQHRVGSQPDHREFTPTAAGSSPADHPPSDHPPSDHPPTNHPPTNHPPTNHPSQPAHGSENGSGPKGTSAGTPSHSHSAPPSAPSHGGK